MIKLFQLIELLLLLLPFWEHDFSKVSLEFQSVLSILAEITPFVVWLIPLPTYHWYFDLEHDGGGFMLIRQQGAAQLHRTRQQLLHERGFYLSLMRSLVCILTVSMPLSFMHVFGNYSSATRYWMVVYESAYLAWAFLPVAVTSFENQDNLAWFNQTGFMTRFFVSVWNVISPLEVFSPDLTEEIGRNPGVFFNLFIALHLIKRFFFRS